MELKKCPNCNKNILVIAKTCKYCGKSIDQQEQNVPNQEPIADIKQQLEQHQTVVPPLLIPNFNHPNNPQSNYKKTILIAASIFVFAVIIVFVTLFFDKNETVVTLADTPVVEKPIVVPQEIETQIQPQIPSKEIEDETNQNAQICGSGVTLRESYSSTSNRITTLKKNEEVRILDSYFPQNENEAICTTTISLYTSDGFNTFTLPIGKAVKIISRNENICNVMFMHPKFGKMTATINSSDLESISGDKWYKIQRNSGETGWVFSKYVILN